MYAVIFRAITADLDEEYSQVANQMRKLAFEKYGCREFVSVTENNEEISISYWDSQAQIEAWKKDSEHAMAQYTGKSKWYEYYKVQVTEVIREYGSNG